LATDKWLILLFRTVALDSLLSVLTASLLLSLSFRQDFFNFRIACCVILLVWEIGDLLKRLWQLYQVLSIDQPIVFS
jgi:hypothetical protein